MKKLIISIAVFSALTAQAYAEGTPPVEIVGTVPVVITLQSNNMKSMAYAAAPPAEKIIRLQKIKLSPSAQNYLAERAEESVLLSNQAINNLPATRSLSASRVELEMNDVPVLDQGLHGACVTFAVTAAVDAAYRHGDYISQLCNLELGEYLRGQSYDYPSGWNGSLGSIVLDQIQQYGVISKEQQRAGVCAGVTEYPIKEDKEITTKALAVENFTAQSKKLMPPIAWRSLQKAADAFSNPDKAAAERLLNQTKQALAAGHRVLIGVVLDTKQGVGALGTYNKVKGDSWILTPEILQDLKNEDNLAGHEMVVTGYDDTAIVVGPNNKKEKGVFKLRNSWSSDAGDNGNYYMTYSYYKLLVDEVDEVLDHS